MTVARRRDKKDKGAGTKVRFKPDRTIFEDDRLPLRHARRAPARAGVPQQRRRASRLSDERTGKSHDFQYKGGIVEFVEVPQHRTRTALHSEADVLRARREDTSRSRSRSSTTTRYAETVLSFVNNINTIEGGTHLVGFRSALTRTLNNYAEREGLTKNAEGRASPARTCARASPP